MRQKSRRPEPFDDTRARGRGAPTLTPAGGHQQVGLAAPRPSEPLARYAPDRPALASRIERLAAGLERRPPPAPTALASWIWPGPAASPGRPQLVAGRQDRDHAGGAHVSSPMPSDASSPMPSPGRARRGRQISSPARVSWPRPRDVGARCGTACTAIDHRSRRLRRHPRSATTASAPGGIGAPVMIRTAVPGLDRRQQRGRRRATSPTTRSATGRIGRAQGVAVHRRVGERRHVDRGDHAASVGRHAAEGIGQRQGLGLGQARIAASRRPEASSTVSIGLRRRASCARRSGAGCRAA